MPWSHTFKHQSLNCNLFFFFLAALKLLWHWLLSHHADYWSLRVPCLCLHCLLQRIVIPHPFLLLLPGHLLRCKDIGGAFSLSRIPAGTGGLVPFVPCMSASSQAVTSRQRCTQMTSPTCLLLGPRVPGEPVVIAPPSLTILHTAQLLVCNSW